MIFNIPIEPYEERYTEQWMRWVPEALENNGIEYENIIPVLGRKTRSIGIGDVLDVYGTHEYKFEQLQLIMAGLKKGKGEGENDIYFFNDGWFPGAEALEYVRSMDNRKKFKIYCIMHAGTWDEYDFTVKNGMRYWGGEIERGWLKIYDKIFVGSKFHKNLIIEKNRDIEELAEKIYVTGIPFRYQETVRSRWEKENIVVFPHRLDSEKNPDMFDRLKKELDDIEGWKFIKTIEECDTKEEYYEVLGKSRIAVSYAEQETFGFAMLEAIANGCVPVVPDRLSYGTMDVYDGHRFNGFNKSVELVRQRIKEIENGAWFNLDLRLDKYVPENVIERMFLT